MSIIPRPSDIEKIQAQQDQSLFENVSDSITSTLRREYAKGKSVKATFAASLINERVQQRIVQEFYKSGWSVSWSGLISDQRDGNFYEVTIAAK